CRVRVPTPEPHAVPTRRSSDLPGKSTMFALIRSIGWSVALVLLATAAAPLAGGALPATLPDAAEQPPPKEWTAQEDHQNMMDQRSEEHTSELQSPDHLVCRLLL